MPGGMPYQIEKGPTLRLIERHLNAGTPKMRRMLDVLRQADQPPGPGSTDDPLAWITIGAPGLWADSAFAAYPAGGGGAAVQRHIIEAWFGYQPGPTGGWVKPDPAEHPDTGHWIAYRGEVDVIVRRGLRWALELALGLGPEDTGPGRQRPWQIELFWKCLAPWFETWVLHRPIVGTGTGLVSVVFVTPSHRGANLSESPVATQPRVSAAGLAHPVPSYQDDYEELGKPHPLPDRPRVPASKRQHGSWVVTHANHENSGTVAASRLGANNVGPSDFADWGITQVGRYEGVGDVVVVAPSMAAGGVKHDGEV